MRVEATAAQIARWRDAPPEAVVLLYRCHWQIPSRNTTGVRQCSKEVEITAGDFQAAAPDA